jgi:hypothetical protein
MLQVARLSPKQLGDSSPLVASFLRSRLNPDGGFADRTGASDLYYTVFGLEGLIALGEPVPAEPVATYLCGFGPGEELDLVHLCCLIRAWSSVSRTPRLDADALVARLETWRTPDGGYHTVAGAEEGSAYGCFLAAAAYQDLGREVPDPDAIVRCLRLLRCDDGGYANQRGLALGLTPTTAAVATLYRHLGEPPPAELAPWLLSRCYKDGGFFATPAAPLPDLLSTATALHALAGLKADLEPLRETCLDFVDSLWTREGGFYGNWADDELDCEYTYYGLLALGHLSL